MVVYHHWCFSALQRAENSSIYVYGMPQARVHRFQCSSASRKFLNCRARRWSCCRCRSFSALQRAENSSIEAAALVEVWQRGVSVLFSEPKIPQSSLEWRVMAASSCAFQCSSASRKFLNRSEAAQGLTRTHTFQCSSASRKFLNHRRL